MPLIRFLRFLWAAYNAFQTSTRCQTINLVTWRDAGGVPIVSMLGEPFQIPRLSV